MSRRLCLAALLAALLPAAPAAAQDDAHRHPGFLFQIRFTPSDHRVDYLYAVYQSDPADPASLMVHRGRGYTGQAPSVDQNATQCPALRGAVAALASVEAPAVFIGVPERYDINAPRGDQYTFQGFLHFPNGAEGQVSFMAHDVPGRRADAQLSWMRGLVRAFDACVPRERQGP